MNPLWGTVFTLHRCKGVVFRYIFRCFHATKRVVEQGKGFIVGIQVRARPYLHSLCLSLGGALTQMQPSSCLSAAPAIATLHLGALNLRTSSILSLRTWLPNCVNDSVGCLMLKCPSLSVPLSLSFHHCLLRLQFRCSSSCLIAAFVC